MTSRRRSTGLRLLLVGLLAAGVSGCGASPQMEGDWRVTSAEGHEFVGSTRPRMKIDGDDIRVNAGCNTMNGRVSLTGDVLKVRSESTTLIGCDQELRAQDEWMARFLADGATVGLEGDTMTLTQGDVTLTLTKQG